MIIPFCFLLWHLVAPAQAQETLSLKECREMALKYNKEMAASVKQTESAHYTAKSYKGNFFPNLTASGTGLYSNADGSYGIAGGNLPVFLPDATGQFNPGQPSGFAYFPGINLDYKIGCGHPLCDLGRSSSDADRKSTRLNSSHSAKSRMPSSA